MITIDGSMGEGGGQVLRTALTLSILSRQAVEIHNIRAGRPNPGLRPQHLASVRAAAAVCDAAVEGAELGSDALRFAPGPRIRTGHYTFDVAQMAGQGSAGAVGLVLQTILLPLALAEGPSYLILRGGTHVPWAPPVDYLQHVFLPTLSWIGVDARIELLEWGFYPVGGGEVRVLIEGSTAPLAALDLSERGELKRVVVQGVAANLPSHIPQRIVDRARNLLQAEGLPLTVEPRRVRSAGPGAAIFILAEYEQIKAGFSAYGRKGLPSEQVAAEACDEMLAHHRSGAPVDPHLADQLVLPLSLTAGLSVIRTSRITPHLLTNLAVVQAFLPVHVRVEGTPGAPGMMTIEGAL